MQAQRVLVLLFLCSSFISLQKNPTKKFENKQLEIQYTTQRFGTKTTISGQIWDKTVNPKIPFEGMNILLKGHKVGTVSAPVGNFKLEVEIASGVLAMSFVGFKKVELNFP